MKLLDKKTINESVQKERKTQIDSGIFLAKKVDKLREDLLNLEQERKDFIEGSQAELDKALGNLKEQKKNLSFEVKEATKELAELREPLDEEWKEVGKQKNYLRALKLNYDTDFHDLIKTRSELQNQKEQADILQSKATQNEQKTRELLEKAKEDREETKRILSEVKSVNEIKEAELYSKDLSLDERERKLTEREETLKQDRLALNKEKKLLEIKKQRIR